MCQRGAIVLRAKLHKPKLFPNVISSWNCDELSVANFQFQKTDHN
jgi:hypothetical protein